MLPKRKSTKIVETLTRSDDAKHVLGSCETAPGVEKLP